MTGAPHARLQGRFGISGKVQCHKVMFNGHTDVGNCHPSFVSAAALNSFFLACCCAAAAACFFFLLRSTELPECPMMVGVTLRPILNATWPRCSSLTWKMCFTSEGWVAYERTNDLNASEHSCCMSSSPATACMIVRCSRNDVSSPEDCLPRLRPCPPSTPASCVRGSHLSTASSPSSCRLMPRDASSWVYGRSLGMRNRTASPSCPIRAVRPTRWTYSAGAPGTSYWMMVVTSGKSRPRAATSVQSSTADWA
mmetsp:Transcript_9048/g.19445  ORF Transcript_9048/g.19445 Transcript_9048/m.19445 type:complete len:253 (-) Transcript_9048:1187-1945(-)